MVERMTSDGETNQRRGSFPPEMRSNNSCAEGSGG